MKKTNKNLTSLSEHIEKQYGKHGAKKRVEFEERFEAFKLGNASRNPKRVMTHIKP